MTLLCDVCLEPVPEPMLIDCVDPHVDHCDACVDTCAPCLAAQADDHAAETAADLERCER